MDWLVKKSNADTERFHLNKILQEIGPAIEVAGDKNYLHVQGTPATVWTIQHDLGKYPSVTVIDSSGQEMVGTVVHNSINQTVVTFTASFSGQATLN